LRVKGLRAGDDNKAIVSWGSRPGILPLTAENGRFAPNAAVAVSVGVNRRIRPIKL